MNLSGDSLPSLPINPRAWIIGTALGFGLPLGIQLLTVGIAALPWAEYFEYGPRAVVLGLLFIGLRWCTVVLAWLHGWIFGILLDIVTKDDESIFYKYSFTAHTIGFGLFSLLVLVPGFLPSVPGELASTISMGFFDLSIKYGLGWVLTLFIMNSLDENDTTSQQASSDTSGTARLDGAVSKPSSTRARRGSTSEKHPEVRDSPQFSPVRGQQETSYGWRKSPQLGLADVAGYDEEKYRIVNSLAGLGAIRNRPSDEQSNLDVEPVNSLLLYGPPGNGKAQLARAIAGEVGGTYLELSPGDILTRPINGSVRKVQTLFKEAYGVAGPVVIFVDNLDGLIPERDSDMAYTHRQVVTEFVNRIEWVGSGSQVLFIGATSKPAILDDAALSPSCFDMRLEIGNPDEDSREELVRKHLANRTHSLDDSDINWLVDVTDGYSCAEIEHAIEDASRMAEYRNADALKPGDFTKAMLS